MCGVDPVAKDASPPSWIARVQIPDAAYPSLVWKTSACLLEIYFKKCIEDNLILLKEDIIASADGIIEMAEVKRNVIQPFYTTKSKGLA